MSAIETSRAAALFGQFAPARSIDRLEEPVETVLLSGLTAGLAGVAVMTLAEKAEQALTGRPNSYVPARTLLTLLGRRPAPDDRPLVANWIMHWGQGAVLGAVRALMAREGVRGPVGSFLFWNVRFATDQTLENVTGVGAPPWTWPRDEQVIDLFHKGVYALVAGAVADALVRPRRR
jgi:hypothetical protein